MEDREHQTGSSHSLTRMLALVLFVWLGAIIILAGHPGATGAAQATGTPFYIPLVMTAPLPTPTPTPIPAPGRIVYEIHIDWQDNWDIYTMRADGTGRVRLTAHPERDSDATWSPDYSKVVFASERASVGDILNREIYVMNADGSNPRRVTYRDGKDYDPSWSPDGTRIAFVSKLDGDWDIYLIDPDGNNVVNLTNNKDCTDTDPSWSPDGSRIAFASDCHDPGQNAEIYTMKADGTDVKRLTHTSYSDGDPSWSWDGTRIAFECYRDHNFEICVMNANGTGQQRITYNEVSDSDPSWQRWGDQIVFGSYRTGNGDVYVMNSDGGAVTQLTSRPDKEGDACARPSGP
jgi:Tol biopolymer transport system component